MTMQFHKDVFRTKASRAAAAALDPGIRFDMIDNLVAEYPAFREGTELIERFHMSPETQRVHTGSIGGVIGEFRAGKSILVKNYLQRFPERITDTQREVPALYVRAEKVWNSKGLPTRILKALGRAPSGNKSPSFLTDLAIARMDDLKVRLLAIDDLHKLLGRRSDVQETALDLILSAADQRVCNVLVCGPKLVLDIIKGRDELLGRGGFPYAPVRAFDHGTAEGEELFTLFLQMVDDRLPFAKPSDLAQDPINSSLLAVSKGSIGFVMEVIKAAARNAIDQGAPCIGMTHLRRAVQDRGALLARSIKLGEDENDE